MKSIKYILAIFVLLFFIKSVQSSEIFDWFEMRGDNFGTNNLSLVSNNVATTWGTNLAFNFTPLSAGKYNITYSCVIGVGNIASDVDTALVVDGNLYLIHSRYLPVIKDWMWWEVITGEILINLDATEHRIGVVYFSGGATWAYVKDLSIMVRRGH